MKQWMKRTSRGFCLFLLALLPVISGCIQTRVSEPPRTAVEQLLLSTAADRSLEHASLGEFNNKKVFVDGAYFESYDKPYVIGSVRDALSSNGALLVAEVKDADIVVEPRSGALATDSSSSLIGIPSVPVPIPLSGTFLTPELYLYKSQKLFSTSKLALLAYDQKSREHVYSSGSLPGKASHKYYRFLGYFSFTKTTIPEKKKSR